MKKSVLIAIAAAAGTAIAAVAAGSIKREGGIGPAADKLMKSKAASGVGAVIDMAKQSSVASAITNAFAILRNRVAGSNDNSVDEGRRAAG